VFPRGLASTAAPSFELVFPRKLTSTAAPSFLKLVFPGGLTSIAAPSFETCVSKRTHLDCSAVFGWSIYPQLDISRGETFLGLKKSRDSFLLLTI
jgi:hypothetical protein